MTGIPSTYMSFLPPHIAPFITVLSRDQYSALTDCISFYFLFVTANQGY